MALSMSLFFPDCLKVSAKACSAFSSGSKFIGRISSFFTSLLQAERNFSRATIISIIQLLFRSLVGVRRRGPRERLPRQMVYLNSRFVDMVSGL